MESTVLRLEGYADVGNCLQWNNSANVLCKYMKQQQHLNGIIRDQAIMPRYGLESVDFLLPGVASEICFPRICFCDIPFSKVTTHMSKYGNYGIALDKAAAIYKYHIQPIQYISEKSPLVEDYRRVFLPYCTNEKESDVSTEPLLDYMVSSMTYMKPIWGMEPDKDGKLVEYVYQDECEWRFVPADGFPKELRPIVLPQWATSEAASATYTEALKNYKECWLNFDWNDIKYIIVPDEKAVRETIRVISELDENTENKDILISKIEISERFSYNM